MQKKEKTNFLKKRKEKKQKFTQIFNLLEL